MRSVSSTCQSGKSQRGDTARLVNGSKRVEFGAAAALWRPDVQMIHQTVGQIVCQDMAGGPVDPREILKGVESLLGKDGELRSLEGVPKVYSLMKATTKMVSRCMYLSILLQTKSHDILNRFIRVGGYRMLNAWLTYSKTTNNSPVLQLILLTLQKLPLKVDHLKQNNTAKLVKQLSKTADTEELRKLATVLVDGWMATIRSQSVSSANSPA
ncbi:hypothetical protein NQZ68_026361, partial [Dissostichus eleginoides]